MIEEEITEAKKEEIETILKKTEGRGTTDLDGTITETILHLEKEITTEWITIEVTDKEMSSHQKETILT